MDKLKDITFEKNRYICDNCKIPLNFEGWITKDLNPVQDLVFLLFGPKKWIDGYYYKCDKCKHIYAKYKN